MCLLTIQESAHPELWPALLPTGFCPLLGVQPAAEDLDTAQTGHGAFPQSLNSVLLTHTTVQLEKSLNLSLYYIRNKNTL